MEFQKIVMEKFPFLRAVNLKEHNRSTERLESKEANSGLSEELLESYHDSFPDIDHDNRPSRTMARKGVVYEPEGVPQEVLDTNIEGFRHPGGYIHDPKPTSTDSSASLSSERGTIEPIVNGTGAMKQNTSSEHLESKEGSGGVSEELLKAYNESSAPIDHGNRSSSTRDRKGVVVYQSDIPPQEGTDSNTEGYSSSVKSTDENIEKVIQFSDKKCVDCLEKRFDSRNASDGNSTKCCDTVQSGKNTSESVSNKSDTAGARSVLPANLTAEDRSVKNGCISEKQDGRNCSSLGKNATSVTPRSRHGLPLHGSDVSKDTTETSYGVWIVLLVLVIAIGLALVLSKSRSKFWKWTHLRYYGYNDEMYRQQNEMYET
jgi:hypothetical protein